MVELQAPAKEARVYTDTRPFVPGTGHGPKN